MKNLAYRIIGVMSGTSLDGIDLVLVDFVRDEGVWGFDIVTAETIAYPEEWKRKLEKCSLLSRVQIDHLNLEYTDYLAETILNFLKEHEIAKVDVEAICSHGHTVWHRPENGLTIQIGNLSALAKKTGVKVVCDFRVQDVELGGQGAPLVPIGDQMLFKEFDYCLNLGGFANISLEMNKTRIAYDICAVNTVLNFLSQELGHEFDEDGNIAASGTINDFLLNQFNEINFYKQPPPKSLGVEWVAKNVVPLLAASKISIKDKISTYTYHVGQQIAHHLKGNDSKKVLITGGGAFNATLIKYIQSMSEVKVVIPSAKIIEYKEALIFGFLGVLRMRKEINVIKSVTGASKSHSSGKIYLP